MAKCYICHVALDPFNTAPSVQFLGDNHYKCVDCANCPNCGGAGTVDVPVERETIVFNHLYETDPKAPKFIKQVGVEIGTIRCNLCFIRILKNKSGLLPGEWDRAVLTSLSPDYGRDSANLISAIQATITPPANKWLAIIGTPGNGKTSALHIIARSYIERSLRAKYFTLPTLIDYLQAGYGDSSYEGRLQTVLEYPVLVLDEFDKVNGERISEDKKQQIFKLVDMRYRLAKESYPFRLTAIAMNEAPTDPYLRSRLFDTRFLTVVNESPDVRSLESNENGGNW